jgi:hypothetical protein
VGFPDRARVRHRKKTGLAAPESGSYSRRVEALAAFAALLSIAALVAVIALAVTAEMWRRGSRRRFGHEVSERYRSLLAELPVSELLLEDAELDVEGAQTVAERHLNTLYRYFDLCEEQVLLRASNTVDAATWKRWHAEVRRNFGRPMIRAAWTMVQTREPDAFPELARLFGGAFRNDDPRQPIEAIPARQAARVPT